MGDWKNLEKRDEKQDADGSGRGFGIAFIYTL